MSEANKPLDLGPISIVVVDVGNSTTAVARWVDGKIEDPVRVDSADRVAIERGLATVRAACENQERQAIVIASVVPSVTQWLAAHIEDDLDLRAFVLGDNTPLPAQTSLAEPETVGVDRVCTTAAAFDHTGHACVVVDVGTAVTIDYIDDDGVFCGGSILPGPGMQVAALAGGTAQLPAVQPAVPQSALGGSTREAIQSGVAYGLVGAVRGIVEKIATERGAWPQVVLTGGGAGLLKDELDFVDNWVPDLCLRGIGLAYLKRIVSTLGELQEP